MTVSFSNKGAPLSSTAVLLALRTGAEETVRAVASFGAGVDGSSVMMPMPPLAVMVAWLPMTVPFARGSATCTRKTTTTSLSAPPEPLRFPMATVRGFPGDRTSEGSSEVRLPGTSVVFAGMESESKTPEASPFPEFVTVIV